MVDLQIEPWSSGLQGLSLSLPKRQVWLVILKMYSDAVTLYKIKKIHNLSVKISNFTNEEVMVMLELFSRVQEEQKLGSVPD